MKQETSKPSFVIAGAGPGGLTLGILLLRQGYPVTILERESGPHRQVCGEYLSPQGVAYLEAYHLGASLRGFRPLYGMRISSPQGRQTLARFPEGRVGFALNRKVWLERLVTEYLSAGGHLFFGESIQGFTEDAEGLSISTSKREFKANALIGADGRSSHVAKLAALERIPAANPRVAIHAYIKPQTPLPPFGQMHILYDGAYAGINPVSNEEVNFSIVTNAEKLKGTNAKELVNAYIRSHPVLSRRFRPLVQEAVKTTFPIECQRAAIVKRRVALIGDASGFIDPLTGEGITTAIKTATLLFQKIQEGGTIEDAFQLYSHARRNDYRQKEKLNLGLQKVIKRPYLCELIAIALNASPRLRSLFIGVIGNIYGPREALIKLFIGGNKHGHSHRRAECLPAPSLFPKGDNEAPSDRLA